MKRSLLLWRRSHSILGLVAVLASLFSLAAQAAPGTSFDHFKTGFELSGQHKNVLCESCHVGGVFKGTPHACVACHTNGSPVGASAKPVTHILSSSNCDACHTPAGWKPVAMFNHIGVIGNCSSCHNNVQTIGKPSTHIPTTLDCGSCHLPLLPWKSATFSHTGVTGNCASCHNGTQAPGKPSTHFPTVRACESCHSPTNFKAWTGAQMSHAGISSGCQSCHETGMSWAGVSMVNRPTAAQDTNHPTLAQGADCAGCHSVSNFAVGAFNAPTVLPVNHMPASLSCANCHTAIPTWSTYVMGTTGHKGITSGCANCHASGKSFLGIAAPALVQPPVGPPAHLPIPSGETCETCHLATSFATGGFGPATPMNHAGITSGCQSCHETGMAWKGVAMVNRPTPAQDANHVTAAQKADCSSSGCHSNSNFAVGAFNIAGKPPGHIPTSASCSQCHTTAGNYALYTAGATLHAGMTTGCATCHAAGTGPWAGVGGLTFVIKQPPANHIPIGSAACEGCHSKTNFTSFSGTPIKHAPVASQTCMSCHEYAMGAPSYWYGIALIWHRSSINHFAGQDCRGCHNSRDGNITCSNGNCGDTVAAAVAAVAKKSLPNSASMTAGAVSATTGLTGLVNATTSGRVNHSGLGGATCVSCHNGVAAVGKEISHPSTSNNCSACHATIAWAPAHVDHAEAHGTCSACHNGTLATTKPVHHVTTHLDCDACHTTSLWKPAVFDHAGVLHGTCLSCHSAATAVKSTSHPPTSLSCDSCHYTVAWLPIKPLRPEVKTPTVIVPGQPVQMPVRPGFGRSLPHLIVP